MKKAIKMMIVLAMAVLMLSMATIPSMAAGFDFGTVINGFESVDNSDNNMDEFLHDAQDIFDNFFDEAEKQQADFEKELEEKKQQREEERKKRQEAWDAIEKEQQTMETVVIVIIVIAGLLLIAEITYIFITAPKCGMSRFWALVPLFSNLVGLLVFIVIRSNRMTTASNRTVTCPTCNGVHPLGTTECSICGTKLQ